MQGRTSCVWSTFGKLIQMPSYLKWKKRWKQTKERSRSSTVEGKRRWLKLFEPSRLDRDRRGSWSQRFTTVRKLQIFFSLSLALLSLLISLIAHFFSCLATSLFHPHHPLHYPTHPQLFKYYFSPSCRCPPPTCAPLFFPPSLYLVIACQWGFYLRRVLCACVMCEHIETGMHLRAHWFKNTFDIGGPLLQIRSGAYHTHIDIQVEICINQSSTPKFLLKLCDWPS